MTESKTAGLDLQFDVNGTSESVAKVEVCLIGLQKATEKVTDAICKGFSQVLQKMEEVYVRAGDAVDSVSNVATEVSSVQTSANVMDWVGSIFDGVTEGYEGLKQGIKKYEEVEKLSKSLAPIFEEVVTAPNISSLAGALFPKTAELNGIVGEWTNTMLIPSISSGLSKVSPQLGSAAGSMLTSITGAFSKIGTVLGGMSVGWGVVIAAIIAGIILLIQNWDTVKAAIITTWEAIKAALATAGEWVNTTIIQPLIAHFTAFWEWIRNAFLSYLTFIQGIFTGISNFLANVFAIDWTEHFGAFGNVLNAFFANIENIWNAIKEIFSGVISFVKSVFAGDWEAAWNSIVDVFGGIWDGIVAYLKIPINGVIGLINGMIQGIVDGLNSVIDVLNGLRFTIPSWIPKIGGNSFSLNLSRMSAYQIPYLAQGAVLPANRPFLAVVGDQKHGTNVEAPLSTIQAAVADVLARQGTGDINITFTGDLAQLGRVLKPVIEKENRRVGGSLAKGVY